MVIKLYISTMDYKFTIFIVLFCIWLTGCTDCSDMNENYAGVSADTTYFAYAESFEYDSTLYPSLFAFRGNGLEPLTVGVDYKDNSRSNDDRLYVEIYGCRTNSCSDANTIVVRRGDYSYVELIYKPQFEITKAKGSVPMERDSYLEKTIYSRFHLNIKTPSIYVSWNFEDGNIVYDEQCPAPFNPGW